MKKEPAGLYMIRLFLLLGLFALMCMLYWSSLLIEDDLLKVKREIHGLKTDLTSLKADLGASKGEIIRTLQGLGNLEHPTGTKNASAKDENKERGQIDQKIPNLLQEDPFYSETLPKLLGAGFKPQGVFHDATIGKPDDLHPFNNWAHISTWLSLCGTTLARMEFGKYETFAPNMAIKIEERKRKDKDVPEYWVHLRDGVYWQPLNERMFPGKVKLADVFLKKHQVTAHDYKFYFDAVMNVHVQKPGAVALRNYIGDIEEIEVIDDLTFVVRWKPHRITVDGKEVEKIKYIAKLWTGSLSPLPGFVYKYFADGTKIVEDDQDPNTYRTNSVWAQNFSEHWAKNVIVSCGAWIFVEMTDREINFRRNPEHFFPLDALAQGMVFEFKNSPDTIWQEFQTNRLDSYLLIPQQMLEYKNFLNSDVYKQQEQKGDSIRQMEYNDRAYIYIGWNMTKPYFKSQKIRQAMTMAIDRNRIIEQYLNGLGIPITGPFYPFSPSYDQSIKPWPYDPGQAKELLQEEGWFDRDGDGIVDNIISGKKVPFEFKLTYYVKNPTTKVICEYIATALKEIGVRCILKGVDLTDLSASFDDKGFDALCLGWALSTPPEDPRQLWYSSGAKEPGSSNAVGFQNKEADAIIDRLDFESDPSARIQLYHRFQQIIYEEQPYTFLYAPKRVLLYRNYVQNVFIPAQRQDLVPGANVAEPASSVYWLKEHGR